MPLPAQLTRLIEGKKAAAMDGITLAFKHATRRVFEREAGGGGISSHGQARAAMACLKEAENRLATFTEDVKRILLAGRYGPTEADQAALLQGFNETMEWLIAQVQRRGQTEAGQSVMSRNSISRALFDVGNVRTKLRHDFEVMLVECSNANRTPAPAVSIVYNLVGDNPRVNHGSIDASTNTVAVSARQLFAELRQAIATQVGEPAMQRQLLDTLTQLERQVAPADRTKAYLDFVQVASPHLSVVTPFLPALAKWVQ